MRILLVQPNYDPGRIGFRAVAMPEPLALELLAGLVPEHEVRILDLRVDSNLDGMLTDYAPELVAVTALTTEVYAAQEILQKAKRHDTGVFTVAGGHHATLMPDDFKLPFVDAICLGEGEFVFPDLVRAIETTRDLRDVPNLIWRHADGRFVDNGRDIPQADGDVIPHARRDLVADYRHAYSFLYDKPDTAMATGRGCPYRCSFCSVWEFYRGKTRQMSPARVTEELRTVPTRHVTFVDDNFMLDARREHAIADLIKAEGIQLRFGMECRTDSIVRHPELVEKWARIGLDNMFLGLEGVSDEALTSVNKQNTAKTNNEALRILHANDVMIWAAFIVNPDWTVDQFKALREYVQEKQIAHLQFTILTPLPGTQLYREKQRELLTHDYTCFDAMHAVLPTRLPREEFYQRFASLWSLASLERIYKQVLRGRLTIEQITFGHNALKQFLSWEGYAERDPILGAPRRTPTTDARTTRRPTKP